MNKKEIKNILNIAKQLFLETDEFLLAAEANERSITHKFAEYLQNNLEDNWDVDCEYNRVGNDSKKIIAEINEIIGEDSVEISDIKAKTVYPDIIVHKRNLLGHENNLLVVEAKKDATLQVKEKEIEKLKKIKRAYGYQFAVFLNFLTKNNHNIVIDFVND